MAKNTEKAAASDRMPRAYEIFKIDPRQIEVNTANLRNIDPKDPEMIRLKASISENGLQQPLTIKSNPTEGSEQPYVAADGNRRLTAIMQLIEEGNDIKEVPVRKQLRMTPEQELLAMFLLNDGQPLNPIEKAEGVRRFKDVYGYEFKEIAAKLSESHTTVQNLYRLAQMPAKVKKLISAKLISSTLALQISRKAKNTEDFVAQIEELCNIKPAKVESSEHEGSDDNEGGEGDPEGEGESEPTKATAKSLGVTNLKKIVKEMAVVLDDYEDEGEANAIALFKEFAELAVSPPYDLKKMLKVFGIKH